MNLLLNSEKPVLLTASKRTIKTINVKLISADIVLDNIYATIAVIYFFISAFYIMFFKCALLIVLFK